MHNTLHHQSNILSPLMLMSIFCFMIVAPAFAWDVQSSFVFDVTQASILQGACGSGRFSIIQGSFGKYAQSLGLNQNFAQTVASNIVYMTTNGSSGSIPGMNVRKDISFAISGAQMEWDRGVGKADWCDYRGGILASQGLVLDNSRTQVEIRMDDTLNNIRSKAPIEVSKTTSLKEIYRTGKVVHINFYDIGTKDQWTPNAINSLKASALKQTCADTVYGEFIRAGYAINLDYFDSKGSGFALLKLDKATCQEEPH